MRIKDWSSDVVSSDLKTGTECLKTILRSGRMRNGETGGVEQFPDGHHDACVVVSGVPRKFPRQAKDGEIECKAGILGDVQRQDVATFLGELLFERPGKDVFDCRRFGAVLGNSGGALFAFRRGR